MIAERQDDDTAAVQDCAAIEDYALRLSRALVERSRSATPAAPALSEREVAEHRRRVTATWLRSIEQAPPFSPREAEFVEALAATEPVADPGLASHLVLVLKATRLCNLRCRYCNVWAEGTGQVMPFEALARVVRQTLANPRVRQVDFVWHGGEVTLLKPKFFRKLVALQQRFRRPGQKISNAIQTNGTRLDDEWLGLIAALQLPVGISIDGPQAVNDARRPMADGNGSTRHVLQGLAALRAAGVNHGVMVVIDRDTVARPVRALLDFLVDNGIRQVDFLNYVPGNESVARCTPEADFLSFPEFARWMRSVYRTWHADYRGDLSIRFLDDLIATVTGARERSSNCYFQGSCEKMVFTIDVDGTVAPCDKFIGGPASDYGTLADGAALSPFARADGLTSYIRDEAEIAQTQACPWFALCNGGCPHDRIAARRLERGHAAGCCGLAPLLDAISQTECGDSPPAATPDPARLHPVGSA